MGWSQRGDPASGIALDFDLSLNFGIQLVHFGWQGNFIASVYYGGGPDALTPPPSVLDLEENNRADTEPEIAIQPYATYQVYGDKVSSLVGTLGACFLTWMAVICSVLLVSNLPEYYSRHFFLPFDWLSTDNALLLALTARKKMVFVKGDELAVIKRGLGLAEVISFPTRSRRSSGAYRPTHVITFVLPGRVLIILTISSNSDSVYRGLGTKVRFDLVG